jgi:hypothetical protein
MEILDGKNHRHGAYEWVALDIILGLLNTGRDWGWLGTSITAKNYAPEAIVRADAVFLSTLRALVDQWIDSGIDEHGVETPSRRYVRGLPKGYSASLFDILRGWLERNIPRPALMTNGRIGILDRMPELFGLELDTYARETAIYYLKELLECPAPHRLGKCKNPKCETYFARKRGPKGAIKRGTYCGECDLVGAAERTRLSRQRRKIQQLGAAAKAWPQWKKSRSYPSQTEWVAARVNQEVFGAAPVHPKWVTQNRERIIELVRAAHASGSVPHSSPVHQ